jgi:peptide/nickel transport system substrate-binding protein
MMVLPVGALASNVGTDITIGIISTKTTEIYPLAPLERDLTSLYGQVYEGLITIDDDYRPKGLLCEYWDPPTGTGKTWKFHLRSGITFSDGTALTANDVVATAQYILDIANDEANTDKGYYGNLRFFIDSISAEDDQTVVVKAARGYYGLLYAMTFPILPADRIQMPNPPGTGPYVISDFKPQDYIWLTTNDKWWRQKPQVQGITATFHTNSKEIIESYEYARVDAVFTRSMAAAQYKSGTASLRLDYRSRQLETLLINNQSYELESVKMRQAIRYAIDVNKIATQVYMDLVSRTDTPMVNGNWLYSDTPGAYVYDVEKAKALLAEEGWKDLDDDGILNKVIDDKVKNLHLSMYVYEDADNNVRVETANMIKDMLAQVGIEVKVYTTDFAEVSSHLSAGSYNLALAAYQMDAVPDPGFMLMSNNTGNYSRYKSEEMTDLCKALRTKNDPDEFAQTLAAIQQKFAQDVPFICLFYRKGAILTHKMYTTARDVRELELLRGIEDFSIDP